MPREVSSEQWVVGHQMVQLPVVPDHVGKPENMFAGQFFGHLHSGVAGIEQARPVVPIHEMNHSELPAERQSRGAQGEEE